LQDFDKNVFDGRVEYRWGMRDLWLNFSSIWLYVRNDAILCNARSCCGRHYDILNRDIARPLKRHFMAFRVLERLPAKM